MVIMPGVPGFSIQDALAGDRPEPADRSICSTKKSQHWKPSETVFPLEWQPPRKTSHTCPHCGKPADTHRSPTEREQKQDWGAWLWCDYCGWNGARDYAAALNIARLGAHFIIHYLHTIDADV